jgi:hypothetical protein
VHVRLNDTHKQRANQVTILASQHIKVINKLCCATIDTPTPTLPTQARGVYSETWNQWDSTFGTWIRAHVLERRFQERKAAEEKNNEALEKAAQEKEWAEAVLRHEAALIRQQRSALTLSPPIHSSSANLRKGGRGNCCERR